VVRGRAGAQPAQRRATGRGQGAAPGGYAPQLRGSVAVPTGRRLALRVSESGAACARARAARYSAAPTGEGAAARGGLSAKRAASRVQRGRHLSPLPGIGWVIPFCYFIYS